MDKIVIITGATSGIGKSLALRFAANKFHTIAIGRDSLRITQLRDLEMPYLIPIQCDITCPDQLSFITDKLKEHSSLELSCLVHNATFLAPIKPLESATKDELNSQMNVNYIGPFLLTNLLRPYLVQQSRILFISTGASRTAITNLVPHCAAKAAQAILAEGFKNELKDKNIEVGLVEPGIVNTPSQEKIRSMSTSQLPFSEVARTLYENGKLISSESCAAMLYSLLTGSENISINWPWNLQNATHHELLIGSEKHETK